MIPGRVGKVRLRLHALLAFHGNSHISLHHWWKLKRGTIMIGELPLKASLPLLLSPTFTLPVLQENLFFTLQCTFVQTHFQSIESLFKKV